MFAGERMQFESHLGHVFSLVRGLFCGLLVCTLCTLSPLI